MKRLIYAIVVAFLCSAAQADWFPGRYEIHSNKAKVELTAYDINGVYTTPPEDIPQFGQLARSSQIAAYMQDVATALTYVYGISASPNLNATLLNSGTLQCARMPGLTGAITTSVGSCATALAAASVNLAGPTVTGTLGDGNLSANVVKYTDTGTNFSGVTPPTIGGNGIATTNAGTYVGTPTGFTGATTPATVTVLWLRVGNMVTLTVPLFSGTSNATTFTITGALPAAEQPVTSQWLAVSTLKDNGASPTLAQAANVSPASSTITFALGNTSAGFTNSGAKGISSNLSFTYQVAQ